MRRLGITAWAFISQLGDDEKPKYEAEKFRYPNAEKEGGGGILAPNLESQIMITKDDGKPVDGVIFTSDEVV